MGLAIRETYVAAISAWQSGNIIWLGVVRVWAMGKADAAAKAESVARRKWPASEGFKLHNAIAEAESSLVPIDEPHGALFDGMAETSAQLGKGPQR